MTTINLEKTLRYVKIQEILRSAIFTEYELCKKEYFDMFFYTPKHILQAQNKRNHWISSKTIWLFD